MANTDFLHPMIYDGPKPKKDMSHLYHGRSLVFQLGPLSEQPGPLEGQKYCDVTEKEGRRLKKQFPDMFRWPEGTQLGPQVVSREELEALEDRIATLEQTIASLAPQPAKKADEKKAKGKEKADEKKAAPEAPDANQGTPPEGAHDAAD